MELRARYTIAELMTQYVDGNCRGDRDDQLQFAYADAHQASFGIGAVPADVSAQAAGNGRCRCGHRRLNMRPETLRSVASRTCNRNAARRRRHECGTLPLPMSARGGPGCCRPGNRWRQRHLRKREWQSMRIKRNALAG